LEALWALLHPYATNRSGVSPVGPVDELLQVAMQRDNADALGVILARTGVEADAIPGLAFAFSPGRPRCAAMLWPRVVQARLRKLAAADADAVRAWLERPEGDRAALAATLSQAAVGFALSVAAYEGQSGSVAALLAAHPALDVRTITPIVVGWTPTILAVAGGSADVVTQVMARRSPLHEIPTLPALRQLLRVAAVFGKVDVWHLLASQPQLRDALRTSLSEMDAAAIAVAVTQYGTVDMMPVALAASHMPPLRSDHWTKRPLASVAAEAGNADVLRWLVEVAGVDPNAAGSPPEANPLAVAVSNRRLPVVRYLTSLPACTREVQTLMHIQDRHGAPLLSLPAIPLSVAASSGDLCIVEALLRWPHTGSSVHDAEYLSQPAPATCAHPLMCAARGHDASILRSLVAWDRLHSDPRFTVTMELMTQVLSTVSFPDDTAVVECLGALMAPRLLPVMPDILTHYVRGHVTTNMDVLCGLMALGYNLATRRLRDPSGTEHDISLQSLWLASSANFTLLAGAGLRVDVEIVGHPTGARFLPDIVMQDLQPLQPIGVNIRKSMVSRAKALMCGWWDPTAATRDGYLSSLRRLLTLQLNHTRAPLVTPDTVAELRPLWKWLSLGDGGLAAAGYIVACDGRPRESADAASGWNFTALAEGNAGAPDPPLPYVRFHWDGTLPASDMVSDRPLAWGWGRRRACIVAAALAEEWGWGWGEGA